MKRRNEEVVPPKTTAAGSLADMLRRQTPLGELCDMAVQENPDVRHMAAFSIGPAQWRGAVAAAIVARLSALANDCPPLGRAWDLCEELEAKLKEPGFFELPEQERYAHAAATTKAWLALCGAIEGATASNMRPFRRLDVAVHAAMGKLL